MQEAGLVDMTNDLVAVYIAVHALHPSVLYATLPAHPTALPALYGTRKKLSATQWHCVLVEYMQVRVAVAPVLHQGLFRGILGLAPPRRTKNSPK